MRLQGSLMSLRGSSDGLLGLTDGPLSFNVGFAGLTSGACGGRHGAVYVCARLCSLEKKMWRKRFFFGFKNTKTVTIPRYFQNCSDPEYFCGK